MTDIVPVLKGEVGWGCNADAQERVACERGRCKCEQEIRQIAADEIERLREMVKWFACNCEGACDRSADDCLISQAALGEKE